MNWRARSSSASRGRLLAHVAGLVLILGTPQLGAEGRAGGGSGTAPPPDADVIRKWTRSCALCHVDGNAGAPRIGDAEAWRPRLAKGPDVLLRHTIEGFNKMPPLGYCMSCEAADFRALIELMAGTGE